VTETYALALWKRLVLWVIDGHTPLDELERMRAIVGDWSRRERGLQNVTLIVIYPANTTMSGEERRSVARMIEDTKSTRAASATVILSGGMVGALHRSILTGFTLLAPPPHPAKVFADVPSAIAFLHPHVERLCGRVPAADVVGLVDALHHEILAVRNDAAPVERS
jgi:hypothetical protein